MGSKSHHVKLIDASKHFMLAQVKALRGFTVVEDGEKFPRTKCKISASLRCG